MKKNIKTMLTEVDVHITCNTQGGYPTQVSGYAIDANTGIKLDGARTVRRTIHAKGDLSNVQEKIVNIITSEVMATKQKQNASHSTTPTNALDETDALVVAFRQVQKLPLLFPDWNRNTREHWFGMFETTILPILQAEDLLSPRFNEEDFREQLKNLLMKKIQDSKKSKGNLRINKRTLSNTLAASQKIYDALSKIDRNLPDIDFGDEPVDRRIFVEQIKSIPDSVRVAFVKLIEDDIQTNPKFVMATVIMLDAGSRTAESAAVIPQIDIIFYDGYASLTISWQEKDGKRCPILKNDNAYRQVPLSHWGSEMVKRCMVLISPQSDTSLAPIRSTDLSAYIKKKLIAAGLTKELWQRFEEEEANNPDRDSNGVAIFDTCAYILRRFRASIWQHVCGITGAETDRLLGHASQIPDSEMPDFRLPSVQAKIAQKLERFVADPTISRHPALNPIELQASTEMKIVPFEKFKFVNNTSEPVLVKFKFEAALPGENISILANSAKITGLKTEFEYVEYEKLKTIIGHAEGVDLQ